LGPAKNPFAGIQNLKSETRNKEEKMSRLQELRDRKKRKILPPAPPTNGSPRPTGVLSSDAASRAVEAEPEVLTSSAALGRKGKALLELAVLESKQSNAEVLTETPAESIAFTEPVPSKDNFSDELYDEAAKALLAHMRDRSVQRIGKVAAKTIVGKVLDLRRVRLYYVEKACHSSEGTLSYSDGTVLRASAFPTHRGSYNHETGETFPSKDSVARKKKEEKKEEKAKKKKAPAPEPVVIEEAPVQEATAGLTVYVDCLPLKGLPGAVSFEDLIAPLVAKVAENNKVATPLLMSYGEGKNHVAGLLRVSSLKGSVLVSSDNPYWAACKTVLVQAADAVIQGIR
jgi:hypothetical protein